MTEPHVEYSRRKERRQRQREAVDARRFRLGMLRLGVFMAGVAAIAVAMARHGWWAWWIVPVAAGFFLIGARLTALEIESARLGRAVAYYDRGLARLQGRWAGTGEAGERFRDDRHLYARDLDLFGTGALYELLCRARTRMGEDTLAAWLLAPAPPAEIRKRQAAVRELAPMLDLREDIAVLGEPARAGVHPERLVAWGEAPAINDPAGGLRSLLWPLTVLGAATVVGTFAYLGALAAGIEIDPRLAAGARAWLVAALLLYGGIAWRFQQVGERTFRAADLAARDVELLAGVLERLERASFRSPFAAHQRAALDSEGEPPSARIAALRRLIDRLDQRDNVFVRLIGTLLLWDVHLACALQDWRAACGPAMRRWLQVVGAMEALASLSAYHYERPEDVFPELIGEPDAALFEAEALAHPLLPAGRAVANCVALRSAAPAPIPDGGVGQPERGMGTDVTPPMPALDEAAPIPAVLVVSGSNMSGKSTLLRSIGAAAVLAQAGAPVRAARLRMSPLTIGASIQVLDSLQEGASRFYAEIVRLRAIVERAGEAADQVALPGASAAAAWPSGPAPPPPAAPLSGFLPPVLFLIDEFLHGTNSQDRRIGAAAIVRGLVGRGAIGLITTHDLALTHIADELGAHGANVHFEDHLEDGVMRFDYRLRPGVVEKSNALELMRSVGLDV